MSIFAQIQMLGHDGKGFAVLRLHYVFFLALLAIVGLSWVESGGHAEQLITESVASARAEAAHDVRDIALGLKRNLSLLHGLPITLGRVQEIAAALEINSNYSAKHTNSSTLPTQLRNTQPFVDLNELLGHAVSDLGVVNVLWVMDLNGNCIGASNAGRPESFVGTNYSDRGYFKASAVGNAGTQFAVGKKTGIPGLYFSAPVVKGGHVIGVVAAKVDLPLLSHWLSRANAFVTDQYGVIIIATDQRFDLRAFTDGSVLMLSEAKRVERYHIPQVPKLGIRKLESEKFSDLLVIDGQLPPVVHLEQQIENEALVVHVLGAVPAIVSMNEQRIIRFAMESAFGVLILLLVSGMIFYIRSIERAKSDLQAHKSRLDEAQQIAQVGSWELNIPTGDMIWSEQVFRIFRLAYSDTTPDFEKFLSNIHQQDRATLIGLMQEMRTSGESKQCSLGIDRADGQPGRVQLQLQPVTGASSQIERCVGTMRDTTEQEQLEADLRKAKSAAEAANRLKSDFLANVSHELKTPMNSILGMSHLALQGDLSPAQRNHIQIVHHSAENLLFVINEILDFSKIEAGKYVMEMRPFELKDVAQQVTDFVRPKVYEKGLEYRETELPELGTKLVGDAAQLEKVLYGLASNSIKFTAKGAISIHIEIAAQTSREVELHFSVQDTGIGMTANQQQHIFQAFSQVDTSKTRKYGGTGLGLVISKNLVEMMGGKIWIDSESGVGTTVHFSIPFEKLPESKNDGVPFQSSDSVEHVDISHRAEERVSGIEVLLVEDNSANQQLAISVLKKFGVNCTLANHGQEALDILKLNPRFDAILMDCHMPVMDGYTATREIKKMEAVKGIPVIALTANTSPDDRRKIFDSGMSDVVAKPYKAQDLFDTIVRWAGHSRHLPLSAEAKAQSESIATTALNFAGVDTAFGLDVAMSDEQLYIKLLLLFRDSEADFAQRFQTAWLQGDAVAGTRIAHSLKGNAGSIGARGVQAAALALESACSSGSPESEIQRLLHQTTDALHTVLEGLSNLKSPDATTVQFQGDDNSVKALIEQLTTLLQDHNLSAYDVAEELAGATRDMSISPIVEKVVKAINRFDMDAALAEIQRLSETLKAQ